MNRPKRFRDLRELVRPEDEEKLAELDDHFDRVLDKHHPGEPDPSRELGFLDMPPTEDDEP